jgi:hypothetical protein
MEKHIKRVQSYIQSLLSKLRRKEGDGYKYRIAFVGYRDFDHGEENMYVWEDFNTNLKAMAEKIGNIEILGGIDLHENLLGGLNFAIQRLNWVQMSKIIIHLADAPPHGREFGDYGDNDPDQTIHQYPTVEVSRIIVSSPLVKKRKEQLLF